MPRCDKVDSYTLRDGQYNKLVSEPPIAAPDEAADGATPRRGETSTRQAYAYDCRFGKSARQQSSLGRRQFRAVITAREQVTVGVGCHLDRGVAEPGLHYFERQFEAAVSTAVDAPRSVEVAQAMQAAVFRPTIGRHHTSRDLRGMKAALDDAVPMIDAALAVGEGEAEFAIGAGEAVLAQHRQDQRRQRNPALARGRFRPPDLAVAIRALAHVEFAALEVDIIPPQSAKL